MPSFQGAATGTSIISPDITEELQEGSLETALGR
jgi:hypothetical protein